MKIKSFKNKNIHLFGGSSGIGLETAKQLAYMGANLFIYARTESRLNAATIEIKKQCLNKDQKVDWISVNISNPEEVKQAIASTVEKYGTPDILINCAGRAYPEHFEAISYQQFEETMKVNLFGIWNSAQSILPYMKQKGGLIVNTSSVAGYVGIFGYTDYAASKFGIIGLSEALRSELKRYNIGVSVLCPPDTKTPGFEIENQTKPSETKAISQGAGIMRPEEVAANLIKGMQSGKRMIIPGFDGKLTYYVKRWFPWLLERIIDRDILKVQKQTLQGERL